MYVVGSWYNTNDSCTHSVEFRREEGAEVIMVRFWSKVHKTNSCWIWTAYCNPAGYGKFKFQGKKVYAHRFAYELLVSPIPEGLVIDHLCRNKSCVNPAHLEPVTDAINAQRSPYTVTSINRAKTHCKVGHPFSQKNTVITKYKKRVCLICRRAYDKKRRPKTKRSTL